VGFKDCNKTLSGAPACAYGTAWSHHFDPPVGTGLGCQACMDATTEPSKEARTENEQT